MTDRDALSLKIPAYIRGELSRDEEADIENLAEKDVDFAADIAFQKAITSVLKAETKTQTDTQFGWAKLSRAIDAEVGAYPIAPSEAINHRAPSRFWQYAAIFLATLSVGQALMMVSGTQKSEDDRYVMAGGSEISFTMTVTLNDAAPVQTLTTFLKVNDGILTLRPNRESQYSIAFADLQSCAAAHERLGGDNGLFETFTACNEH